MFSQQFREIRYVIRWLSISHHQTRGYFSTRRSKYCYPIVSEINIFKFVGYEAELAIYYFFLTKGLKVLIVGQMVIFFLLHISLSN